MLKQWKSVSCLLACLSSLLVLSAPGQAQIAMDDHYLCDFPNTVQQYRYFRWYPEELPLRVYIPEPHHLLRSDILYTELVMQAFMHWQQKVPPFKFVRVAQPETAEIQIVWYEHFAEGESTWGRAMYPNPYQTPQGIRHRSQIHLALSPQKGTGMASTSQRFFSADELLMIATHEVGHALGLPHSRNRNDIMSPSVYRLVGKHPWQISSRDVATLIHLYTLPWNLEVSPCP